MDVHHHHYYFSPDKRIENKLDQIVQLLNEVINKENAMSEQLDALTVEVQETVTVEQSAIVLLEGLSVQIAELKNDPAALQTLADSLDASSKALAAAVLANTPAV